MAANPSGPHDRLVESSKSNHQPYTSKNLKFKKTPSEILAEKQNKNESRADDSKPSDSSSEPNRKETVLRKSSRSNCQCTNISIMQLFHEMKQEFPKVPDHIVTQCVVENCHNRSACVESLSKETINSVQNSYPSQSLMNRHQNSGQNNNNNNQNVTNSSSTIGGSVKGMKGKLLTNGHQLKNDILEIGKSFFERKSKDKEKSNSNSSLASSASGSSISGGGGSDKNNSSDMPYSITNSNESLDHQTPPQQQPQQQQQYFPNQHRPTTLNLAPEHFNSTPSAGYRITRAAPPPPPPNTASSSSQSSVTSPPPFFHNFQQTTSYGSPTSPGTISLKVTNSPKLGGGSGGHGSPSPRHKTTINLQPDLPGLCGGVPPSGRSFTSVHLDVRPPSDSPQSPINITAGPMKFSSSSYNAQQGHQSHMEITIGGDGGTFSTMRKRTGNFNAAGQPIGDRLEMEGMAWTNQEIAPIEGKIVFRFLIINFVEILNLHLSKLTQPRLISFFKVRHTHILKWDNFCENNDIFFNLKTNHTVS